MLMATQHSHVCVQHQHAQHMHIAARMLTNAQASTSTRLPILGSVRRHVMCLAAAADSATTAAGPGDEDGADDIEWIEIAKISVHHGVRGEVKVQPLTDFAPLRLGRPGTRCVAVSGTHPITHHRCTTQVSAAPRGAATPCCTSTRAYNPTAWPQHSVQGVSLATPVHNMFHCLLTQGHDMWLVKLNGYDTPESVRELRNYTLLIREDERDPDEELEGDHEFYVQVFGATC